MTVRLGLWVIALALGTATTGCRGRSSENASKVPPVPEMVGREVCSTCHAQEDALWVASHHALAMQPANETTVLGAFDGRRFQHAGVTSSFSHDSNGFHVRTDGPDGALHDYRVAYTFGVDPLQQYLIEITSGRFQALSVFWDARPETQGGGEWRHLHPDQAADSRDPLHWTGPYQNWNYMCAECHSTGLRRGYSITEDRFHTTWSEIDVACEACHGPGSRHIAWARDPNRGTADNGLTVRLDDHEGGDWVFAAGADIARRSRPRASQAVLETCALCHARRIPLLDGYVHGRPLADSHSVELLDYGVYHPDGQILEEDYEYGSFLQSAMHRAGVTCTDCHDPHAAGKRPLGDGACARCHLRSRFAEPAHHHHLPGSAGASCMACHMPTRTYMVVDQRHDHSFRVPRPDLSIKIGAPNACTSCHSGRTASWAANVTARWYPNGRGGTFHYGEALYAGRVWATDRAPLLRRVTADLAMPPIVRATALSLLSRQIGPADVKEIERALGDADPIVRRAGLAALASFPPNDRWIRARRLLSDPIRSVRLEAAEMVADMPQAPETVFAEYLESQRCNADRAEAWLTMGSFHLRRGDLREAEKDYRTAISRVPSFTLAYVNLADLYRIEKRESEGEALLLEALRRDPASPDAHYALGLLLVRRERTAEGIEELEKAAAKGDDPRFSYALGIALSAVGRFDQALRTLREAYRRFPGYREIVLALATLHRDHGSRAEAIRYADRLVALEPSDPAANRLLADLKTH
jgi:tetratricopeptide (TPR) repeat protein